jgi:hypothetical protein
MHQDAKARAWVLRYVKQYPAYQLVKGESLLCESQRSAIVRLPSPKGGKL